MAVTAHRKPSPIYGKPLVQRFSGKFARKSPLDKDEQILRALFTRGERLPMARARPSITNLRFRRMPAGKRVHDAPNGQSERKQSSQPTIVTIKQKKKSEEDLRKRGMVGDETLREVLSLGKDREIRR